MKKITSTSFIICCFLCALSSCDSSQKKEVNKSKPLAVTKKPALNREDEIINLIVNLEEVKRKTAEVKKLSKGKRTLSTYIENTPTDKDPYYWVKVSEDNGGSLVAYYTFAVDPKTRNISYYDNMQDSMISLDQWRKSTPVAER
jgi:hypothetical protein